MSLYVPANTDSVLRLCFGFGAALSVLHLTSVYPVNLNSLRHLKQKAQHWPRWPLISFNDINDVIISAYTPNSLTLTDQLSVQQEIGIPGFKQELICFIIRVHLKKKKEACTWLRCAEAPLKWIWAHCCVMWLSETLLSSIDHRKRQTRRDAVWIWFPFLAGPRLWSCLVHFLFCRDFWSLLL